MKMTREQAGLTIRAMMRSCRSAALSTQLVIADGWAYGALVTVTTDFDGSPLMLFSDLSDHSRNIKTDPRASLLFERASRHQNPQRGPRVTILGHLKKTNKPEHQARFLARHPEAEHYARFADFHFYRMTIERAHWVGGFARAQWLNGRQVTAKTKAAKMLAVAESDIIEHMNTDHAEAIDLYASALHRKGAGWQMTGVDPDGVDITLNGRFARLPFARPVADAAGARSELVRLAEAARKLRKT